MDTIKVYLIDTNDLDIKDLLSFSYLKNEDIIKIDSFNDELDKKEHLASSIFKNKYVGEYVIDQYGKPISKDIYFNISHSSGVVVFVKDISPIGIDIEKIRPISDTIKNKVLSFKEREFVKSNIDFFKIWTSKESLSKVMGKGLTTPVNAIPSLPIVGSKEYLYKIYYSNIIEYNDHVISITRENKIPFDIEVSLIDFEKTI